MVDKAVCKQQQLP